MREDNTEWKCMKCGKKDTFYYPDDGIKRVLRCPYCESYDIETTKVKGGEK